MLTGPAGFVFLPPPARLLHVQLHWSVLHRSAPQASPRVCGGDGQVLIGLRPTSPQVFCETPDAPR